MSLMKSTRKKQLGFTLIELIAGILVLTISLSIVSTLISPAEERSADNVLLIKASALGQSLMNDILSRAFDDNSDMSGGAVRCGEPDNISNPCTSTLGVEGDEDPDRRDLFDDVDDFNNFTTHVNSTNDPLNSGYEQFTLRVDISYGGTDLGIANELAKRITITVTTPLDTSIELTSHKANF